MTEVTRCQYFVSMLGVRYGWSQTTEAQSRAFKLDESSGSKWEADKMLADTFENGKKALPCYEQILETYSDRSITEIEIRCAALNCAQEDRRWRRVWFHLREDGYVPQLVADGMVKRRKARDAARYLSEDDIKGAKARRLRREILVLSARPEEEGGCGRGEAEVLYREPKEVAERIGRDLVAALAEDLPAECRSLWAVENFDQAAAARALLRTFVKGDAYVELERQIIGARGAGRTHAIVGPEGSGKSSMCAHLDMSARENKGLGDAQIDFVHMHMAGCSRYGANPLFVMRRIMHELKGHFEEGAPESTRWPDVPTTPAEALNQLDVFLRLAGQALAARGALGLIIVDGVDKLDTHSGGGPAALVWLKWKMPFNILLVLSFSDMDAARSMLDLRDGAAEASAAVGAGAKLAPVSVPAMSSDDSVTLVGSYLERYSKSLSETQKDAIRKALESHSTNSEFVERAATFFGREDLFQPLSTNQLPRYLGVLAEEVRKLGTFERLDADTEALVAHRTAVELISFVMDKAAQVLDSEYGGRKGMSDGADGADGAADKASVDRRGAELFKCVATMIAHTSQGLQCQGVNNELWQCVLAYQALMQNDQKKDEPLKAFWDPLQLEHTVFTLRPFVRRVGAVPPLLALAHPEVEQAIRTTPMADADREKRALLALEQHFSSGGAALAAEDGAVMARQVQELPRIYERLHALGDDAPARVAQLRAFLGRLDV